MARWASSEHPPLVRALLQPDTYPHPAEDIQLIETHSSWVVLAGAYAYKLRKPVDLGFLDFSTRERRVHDCAEEVRLNRRLSPDLYLGMVELFERDGRYVLGEEGHGGEPVVKMRRLPGAGMLTELLARGEADVPLMRRIARRLERFHREAATGPGVDEYGTPEVIRANWAENFDQMAPFVGRTIDAEENDAIRTFVGRFFEEHEALFARRVSTGRIRDGHGDLHAGSICLDGDRLYLFDCLQFAPRFRCADVAAEVAFLAMDLAHYGRTDLAWAFVDTYVHASGDVELHQVLDFYVCYRAYVRGKVRSLRLAQPDVSVASEREITQDARAYFDLAWAHAGGLSQGVVVVTMGLPASGKTSLARALASHLGLVHLSSDVTRKALVGMRPSERRTDAFQGGLYAPAMTARTYAAMRRRAARWLRRGQAVVLDATYGDPGERAQVRRLAHRLGARLVVLVCRADDAVLRARLVARASDAGSASDARLAIWSELRAAFTEPTELVEAISIDATAPFEDMVAQALEAVRTVSPARMALGSHCE